VLRIAVVTPLGFQRLTIFKPSSTSFYSCKYSPTHSFQSLVLLCSQC